MFLYTLIKLLRIFYYKFRKVILFFISQMSKIGAIVQKVLKVNTGNSARYAVFGILIGLFLVMYGFPAFMKWTRWFQSGRIATCMDSELYEFDNAIRSNDAVYAHNPRKEHEIMSPMPLAGNGYVLVSLLNGELYIRHHRTLSLPSHAGILFAAEVLSDSIAGSEKVILTHTAESYVQTIQCFFGLDHPASVHNKVYAHRNIPSLIVQELTIKNPSSSPLKVKLHRQSSSQKNEPSESALNAYVTPANEIADKSKLFFSRKVLVDIPDDHNSTMLHVLQSGVPADELLVQAHKTETLLIYTLAEYAKISESSSTRSPADEHEQSTKAQKSLNDKLSTLADSKLLFRQHSETSRRLFRTGFGISHSKAPDAVNGDRVNLTLYYVLAHYPTVTQVKPGAGDATENSILNADKCYDDHHTLQFARLWDMPTTIDQYFGYCRSWILSLEKHGCRDLVAAGAEGVLTAMVLSFGGLHFTSHHLEFTIHPSELHRDLMHFRGIAYGPRVKVNISVQMGEDNKAQLFVSIDNPNAVFYACDAGCLDAPIQLTQSPSRLPVKLTDPVMPILYITNDKVHIEELKEALHFKHIQEAPAHEDDVIALHKHGHQFGGLPTIFWVTISLLIVIFHLFLIKLIVTEYYKTESKFSPPPTSYHRMARFAA